MINNIFQNHQVIAVDCDDVLSETIPYFLEFFHLENTLGEKVQLRDIQAYDFSKNKDFGRTNDEFVQMFIDLYTYDTDLCNIPPNHEALEILTALKNEGKELHVVTARQSFFESYTKKWIEKYFPGIFTDIHFCNHEGGGDYVHKSDICKQIGAGLLLDDSLTNAQVCIENDIDVVLFTKPWNKNHSIVSNRLVQVDGWNELKKSF